MKVYFNHVGQPGASQHFPMTIDRRRDISEVKNTTFPNEQVKTELIKELQTKFPDGKFNCWGAPAGAIRVIKSLASGDVVLLVESVNAQIGTVPVLCVVKTFIPQPFPELSHTLWGDDHFPYVFFFDTQNLELSWIQFLEYLGYEQNFNPRGNYYSIKSTRLENFGGEEGFYQHLLNNHLVSNTDSLPNVSEPEVSYIKREQENDYEFQKSVELSPVALKTIIDEPKQKPEIKSKSTSESWTRNPIIAKNALNAAHYLCEINHSHKTFKSNLSGNKYVEAHHLIPISYQGSFKYSLDVESNINSLCPNCHRLIHLAVLAEKRPIIATLYELRKDRLAKAGLQIDLDSLLKMYN